MITALAFNELNNFKVMLFSKCNVNVNFLIYDQFKALQKLDFFIP